MDIRKANKSKEEFLSKTGLEILEDVKKTWKNYDKWANFQWGWWKREDRVRWPRFDGQGEARPPCFSFSGRNSVEPFKFETQAKLISNTWFNSFYTNWKVLHDELGREKAIEIVGYQWFAQVPQISQWVEGMDEKDKNCIAVSKMLQMECLIEGCDIDVVEESPQKAQLRLLCNWWRWVVERWGAQGIGFDDMGVCEPCSASQELYGQAVNPKIVSRVTAHPLDTGSYCEITYQFEE